jgi:hypothetical protein
MTKGLRAIVGIVALVLGLGASAEAQLAKQGSFSQHFGWYSVGKVFELDKDHVLFVGEFSGTVFNDAGEGFEHLASQVCPGVNDINKGTANAHGYCTVTDKEGDRVSSTWKCQGPFPRCDGEWQFTGGTGKYAGIRGAGTFTGHVLVPTSSGYSESKGEWRLP